MNYLESFQKLKSLVSNVQNILIVQADNPDADSLGSSIALSELLKQLGIQSTLYCAVNVSEYLRYIDGYDLVTNQTISQFDLTFFLDVSTTTLLKKIIESNYINQIKLKPVIVIDHHHEVQNNIDFSSLTINDPDASSTGQIVFKLSQFLNIKPSKKALNAILASILGDTQGLSNQLTKSSTYRDMADLIDLGADRFELDQKRKEWGSIPIEIFQYKADLIKRTEFYYDNQIAILILRQDDINQYSSKYNQIALMQNDILQVQNVKILLIVKYYADQHLTTSIRSNYGYPIASSLAGFFHGGGHDYASGINIEKIDLNDFKKRIILKANELLNGIH